MQATASLASCFDGDTILIDFFWNNTYAEAENGISMPLLELDPISRFQPTVRVSGSLLLAGVTYDVIVTGCMREQPSVCGSASRQIRLKDEPLQAVIVGGDRELGEDDAFLLDACSSHDPDDPTALLSYAWSCTYVAAENASIAPTLAGRACESSHS